MGEDFDEDELARHRAGIRIGGRGRLEEHLIPTMAAATSTSLQHKFRKKEDGFRTW